jgi:hypothetical protein
MCVDGLSDYVCKYFFKLLCARLITIILYFAQINLGSSLGTPPRQPSPWVNRMPRHPQESQLDSTPTSFPIFMPSVTPPIMQSTQAANGFTAAAIFAQHLQQVSICVHRKNNPFIKSYIFLCSSVLIIYRNLNAWQNNYFAYTAL